MVRLQSYVCDRWEDGTGPTSVLVDPSTEEPLAETTTGGIDFQALLDHARRTGGPALRAMTFAQRAAMVRALCRSFHEHRDELLSLSERNNGATRSDSKFDVDGAIGTLAAYADVGERLGDRTFLLDGDLEQIGRSPRYAAQHVRMPRPGVAVHINAFNFPAWGAWEKGAVSLLAGVPFVCKPATSTALVAWRMAQIAVESGALPPGAISFVAGRPGDLLAHLGPQDVLAFTGSATTGESLRALEAVVRFSARINVEADSLNAAVLGPDVAPGDDLWNLFVRNVATDTRQKTGQKCTAIRRAFVPAGRLDEACAALADELGRIRAGNTADPEVTMGPVATAQQLADVRAGIRHLAEQTKLVCGGADPLEGRGAPAGRGYFVAPTLLRADDAGAADRVHCHEVFGPCVTALGYGGGATAEDVAGLVALGQGCLVSSVYTDDADWLRAFLVAAAPWNGRILAAGTKVADQTTPPGMVLPAHVHGGPGRAGGGEELGGLRGLEAYTQRTAIQGDRAVLVKVLGARAT